MGCKLCEEFDKDPWGEMQLEDSTIRAEFWGDEVMLYAKRGSGVPVKQTCVTIHYCPFCGRKFKKEETDNG